MPKTAYIIDSTATISDTLRARPDVYEVPLSLIWDDEVIQDTSDPSALQSFYQRLAESDTLPMTSQPDPTQWTACLDEIVAQGYQQVLMISMAKGLSGTYQTMQMIASEYQSKLTIRVVDSKRVSFVMERMLMDAIELEAKGWELDAIVEQLEWFAAQSEVYVVIPHLENLVKGGRLSKAGAFIGGLLQIHPIVYFTSDSKVDIFEKQRTLKRVYQRYLQIVDAAVEKFESGIEVGLAHGDNLADTEWLSQQIKQKYPHISIRTGYLSPVIGTHGGKDCMGLGILPILPKN